ncbi:MAG TPA: TonB-dependent receptor [Bryobacteraceae bacterium]|jgi:hypothetical protein|nr:TonB-dependent receptor [Bryobacteraceae bacterium]
MKLACALLLSLCAIAPAIAQFESGTVLGTVQDPSHAIVSGASVTLINVRTGVTINAKTDNNGDYEFVNQRLGQYRVRVTAQGFDTSETEPFELAVNARQRVNVNLQVGQSTQSVTVSGAAALLETDNSSRGQVINTRAIVDLPLNGRAYADLTLLVPGVAKSPLENGADSNRDASYNVNGGRSELNNFMLDGVDNNAYGTSNQGFSNQVIQPNPDALQEFKVETNNYSAEFGRASGAVINASVKSGTNQLHGELWEFMRNTDLNAVGFFRPLSGTLPFNQNQFGAAAGGRVVKDKLFVFGDYEGFRRVSHPLQFATVPTAAMDAGDLSAFGASIVNPLNGQTFPNGVIPKSQFAPVAAAALATLPLPNVPGGSTVGTSGLANNYESSPADTISNDKGDFRADYYVSPKFTLFARYSQFDTRIFSPPNIPGPAGGNANGNVFVKTKQGVLGGTYTISPTSILEARLGIDYTQGGKTPSTLGQSNPDFVIPGEPTDPSLAGGLFSVGLSGFSALGRQSSNPQYQNPFVADPKINFTKIRGRHSLKMGFEFQLIDTAVSDFHPQYGVENFTGYFSDPTYLSNPSSVGSINNALKEGYGLADFIFGAPNHYELDNNPIAHYRQRMYFGYLQDDFRVSSKLTLNLGVRYEFATPQYERDNRLANFSLQADALIYAKDGSLYNRALVHPQYNNWAPRVGLAYQIAPKTVIRSGYGVSYVQFNRMGGENLLAYNGPFIVDAAIDQIATQPICASGATAPGSCFRSTAQGFPDNFASPQAFNSAVTQVRYIPEDNRTGYVQSWHFTVQHELAHNLLLDVAYVGNHDVGLTILSDANQALPNQIGQNLTLQQRRPIPNFSGIEIAFDGGFGSYNALQVKLEKRFSHGIYLLNSFTWSKAIDNAPGHLENYDGDNSRINYYNTGLEKGLSSYNQPLNDTTAFIYDLPFGKGRRFKFNSNALDTAFGGWQVNLINTMTSGLPLNVGYSASTQAQISSLVSSRPNLTGQPIYLNNQNNKVNYLNSAAFSVPNYYQPFGSTPRNVAKNPAFYETDFSIYKNFKFTETRFLQFRAEAFNLLNYTNFAPPGQLNANSSGFGVFTSAFPARQIQLALKLVF